MSSKRAAEVEMERKIFHIDVQLVLLHRPLEREIREVENKRKNNGGGGIFWVNVYLETNGSFYVNKKEPEEYRWEANSFFWGKHGRYSPICLSVDNLNFYLCATHIAPRHKCLLRRTTCTKSSGWWDHAVIKSLKVTIENVSLVWNWISPVDRDK